MTNRTAAPVVCAALLFLNGCGFEIETNILGDPSTGPPIGYRQQVIIDNGSNPSSLNDFQVPLAIDTGNSDFWSNTQSSGPATFIFFDDFEDNDTGDWVPYQGGGVSPVSDPDRPAGSSSSYSMEKNTASDPNGATKEIGSNIGLGHIFEGRMYRPDPYNGGR